MRSRLHKLNKLSCIARKLDFILIGILRLTPTIFEESDHVLKDKSSDGRHVKWLFYNHSINSSEPMYTCSWKIFITQFISIKSYIILVTVTCLNIGFIGYTFFVKLKLFYIFIFPVSFGFPFFFLRVQNIIKT